MHAIAQWIPLHADRLRAALPTLTTLPSESTLLRVTRQIDVSILESAIAQLTQPSTEAETAAGQVVTPGLAQDHGAQKRNEITAVPALLAGRDLTDTGITMDALLTQRALYCGCGAGACGIGAPPTGIHRYSDDFDVALSFN